VAFVVMLPLATMGVPFPVVLYHLGQTHERLLPWAWAVNGCASVVAGLLATLLALTAGLPAVMLAASVCYLITATVARTWKGELPDDLLRKGIAAQAMMLARD
jgi:hypothetical protein